MNRPISSLSVLLRGALAIPFTRGLLAACVLVTVPRLFAAAAPVPVLAWRDLVNHPERWPAKVTLGTTQEFEGGFSVKAGSKLAISAVGTNDVTLVASDGSAFQVTAKDCDLLRAANAQWAGLTDDQRALTLPAIEKDLTLWPAKVTMLQEQHFGNYVIKEGQVVRLIRLRGHDASLYIPGQDEAKVVDVAGTDLFARARAFAAIPREQRPGRMAQVLDGLMVDASNRPVPIKAADYYVQYWSASTCPRCAVFTPKFVEHYNATLAGKANVAFFGSSTDTTMPPYFAYVKRTQMEAWPILPPQNKYVMMALGDLGSIEIPGIIVFDKYGNLLMSTSHMRGAPLPVAEVALTKLNAQVKAN